VAFTLIIGHEDDLCCKLVRNKLEASGREVVYLPENRLFPNIKFAWELRDGRARGSIGFAGHNAPLDQLGGVLARFSGFTTPVEEYETKDGKYLNAEWHALARGYVHSLPCTVVNRLRPELWYKPYLSGFDLRSLVPHLKFRVAKTLITTKFADACAFYELCGRRIRYSPLSAPSNYLIERDDDLAKLESLAGTLPLCLTEALHGDSVRMVVVGDTAFAENTTSQDEFLNRAKSFCVDAASSLGLTFCEFDLLKTPKNEWYCRAINSTPHLFARSAVMQEAIVDSLADLLCAGRRTLA
jgi:hypothetical protein